MPLRRWVVLLALSAGPACAEAVVLQTVHFDTAMALAPQITAPAPYGTFHDLRWLLVYHPSWPALVLEVLAALAVRTALAVGLIVAAAPERPPLGRLVRRVLGFNALALVVLAPWAAVSVAAAATSLSWFLFGEVLPVLLLGLVLQAGGVGGAWWRGLPAAAQVGWGMLGFAAVTAEGVAVAFTDGWWGLPVAALGGAANGMLWYALIRSVGVRVPRLARFPAVPAMIVLLNCGLLVSGQLDRLGAAAGGNSLPPVTSPQVSAVSAPVIVVSGYDSRYSGDPAGAGLPMRRFSYRGLDGAGRPLPYRPIDTHRSLSSSADLLGRQVRLLYNQTGRRVDLVAQSEGTLVVRAYLDRVTRPPVDVVVQLSPLVRPGRVYYPPPQAGSGWGIGTGWLLRGLLALTRWTGGPPISADEPFARSLLDDAPDYRDHMLCPVPGVRLVAFVPLVNAAVVPPGRYSRVPVVGLPGWHATLLDRPDVQRTLVAVLAGGAVPDAPGPWYPVVQRAGAAWQAPALALALNPAWHAAGRPDTAFGQDGCRSPTG